MHIAPVSFTGQTKYLYGYGTSKEERYRDLDKELKQAWTARKEGIDAAPNYMALPIMNKKGQELSFKYIVNGEPANVKDNPISETHLKNLFTNFYKLEKIGLCHKSLSQNNVFYDDKGKVEIGSMKNAQPFVEMKDGGYIHEEDYNLPSCAFPSNADSYELNGLCYYIADFDDDNEEIDFVRKYLQQKSVYHDVRADFLVNQGFSAASPTVVMEDIKSIVFDNPSDEVVEYTKDKLELFALNKEAKHLWYKGNKFVNGKAKPKERFASVILMLEALRLSASLNKRTKELSETSDNDAESYYFALENEYLKSLEAEIFNDVQIYGDDNFCCPQYGKSKGLFLGSKKDRKFFNDIIEGMKLDDPFFKTDNEINMLVKLYKGLTNSWSPAMNDIHGRDFELNVISGHSG